MNEVAGDHPCLCAGCEDSLYIMDLLVGWSRGGGRYRVWLPFLCIFEVLKKYLPLCSPPHCPPQFGGGGKGGCHVPSNIEIMSYSV